MLISFTILRMLIKNYVNTTHINFAYYSSRFMYVVDLDCVLSPISKICKMKKAQRITHMSNFGYGTRYKDIHKNNNQK